MLSTRAVLSQAIQVGNLRSQNWAETTVVNWAEEGPTRRGVDRVTSSHTHRVPAPDIEHINCE